MTHPTITLELRHSPAVDFIRHLREAKHESGGECPLLLDLANQIEAQSESPKPEEPTGLGAVIEDMDGATWIRIDAGSLAPWRLAGGVTDGTYRYFRHIDAVAVRFEGVPA